MKKRHEQKLIVLSLALMLLFSLPIVLLFNSSGMWFGIPTFYLVIFGIWAVVIVISYVVLTRHYE